MKTIGKTNVINEPRKIATPNKIDIMPRYIGCLLNLNGHESIKKFGISCGLTVVCFSLKSESVQRFIIIPKRIKIIPK
jgi:hypothetical protein